MSNTPALTIYSNSQDEERVDNSLMPEEEPTHKMCSCCPRGFEPRNWPQSLCIVQFAVVTAAIQVCEGDIPTPLLYIHLLDHDHSLHHPDSISTHMHAHTHTATQPHTHSLLTSSRSEELTQYPEVPRVVQPNCQGSTEPGDAAQRTRPVPL